MERLQSHLDHVQQAICSHKGDQNSQAELLDSIKKLQIAAEGPQVYASTLRFEAIHQVCLFVAAEKGILDSIVSKNRQPVTASAIAAEIQDDEMLITRTMRVLTSLGVGEEIEHCTYASNEVAEHLCSRAERASLEFGAILLWPLVGEIASYMRQSGLVQFPDPEKPSQKSSFEHRFGGPLWAVLQKDADMKRMYDDYMSVRKYGLDQLWYNVFPAAARLKKESTSTSSKVPTIVDVGGGQGQDLVRFLNAHRDGFGSSRYVLEDLPETTRHLGHLPKNIQVVTHNFFNEQPVRGAQCYFLHNILHDFSDDLCRAILRNIAEAMSYESILLVYEFVLRDKFAQRRAALIDWTMLMHAGGIERSLSQWTELLPRAGLKIVKIWSPEGEGESVIEAKLKEA